MSRKYVPLEEFCSAVRAFSSQAVRPRNGAASMDLLPALPAAPVREMWMTWLRDEGHPVAASIPAAPRVPLGTSLAGWLTRSREAHPRAIDSVAVRALLVARYLAAHWEPRERATAAAAALSRRPDATAARAKAWASLPVSRTPARLAGGLKEGLDALLEPGVERAARLAEALYGRADAEGLALDPLEAVAELADVFLDLTESLEMLVAVPAAPPRDNGVTAPAAAPAPRPAAAPAPRPAATPAPPTPHTAPAAPQPPQPSQTGEAEDAMRRAFMRLAVNSTSS